MPSPDKAATTTFEKKLNELRDIVRPSSKCPRKELFFIERDVRAIWKDNDIRKILPGFTPLERHEVLNHFILVLSILVFIEWDPGEAIFRREFFEKTEDCSDARLPFEPSHDLSFMGRHVERLFRDYQTMFKACKIITRENMKVVQYSSDLPWPFLDKEPIAAGSQSRVWKVSVAPGYYSSGKGQSNEDVAVLAYKRVRRDTVRRDMDYRKELNNLEILRESISEHKHICLHIAAIVHGLEFYVFLNYTELGDLEIFLRGGQEIQDDTQTRLVNIYNFEESFGNPQPSQYVRQLRNLASALHYLHEQLKLTSPDNSSQESFYCAHLDLKPKNILVFPHDDRPSQKGSVGKWMISDFGISSFESTTNRRLRYQTIGDIYNSTSGPFQSCKREGAHVAPELHEKSLLPDDMVVKCDIWSYGCILTRVLAFMYGAMHPWGISRAVSEVDSFRVTLESGGQSDSFFEFENRGSRPREQRLKHEVVSYLGTLTNFVKSNRPLDVMWINPFVELIMRVLVIAPVERPRAEDIMDDLEKIEGLIRDAHVELKKRQASVSQRPTPDAPSGDQRSDNSSSSGASDPNNYETPRQAPSLQPTQSPNRVPTASPTSSPPAPSRKFSDTWSLSFAGNPQPGSSVQDSQASPQRTQVPWTPTLGKIDGTVDVNEAKLGKSKSPSLHPFHSPQSSVNSSGGDNNAQSPWSINLFEGYKRKRWALSSSAETAAYLVPTFDTSSPYNIHVFDLKKLSNDDRAEDKLNLGDFANSARWDDADDARLFIAGRYVSITGLTRGMQRIGLMFNADTGVILQDPSRLPQDLVDIVPSSSGIFAVVCGKKNQILLEDPSNPRRNCRIDGKPGMQFLRYAFSSDGKRFFVWTRSQEADRSSQKVSHSITLWDISDSPNLPFPRYYKFDASVVQSREEDLSLVPCQFWPACIYTKGTSRYFLWADEKSKSNVCKVVPIPDETFPGLKSYAEIACGIDWIASVRTSSFFSTPRLYQSFFQVSRKDRFERLIEKDVGSLKNHYVLLAAADDIYGKMIIVAYPHGKIIRVRSP